MGIEPHLSIDRIYNICKLFVFMKIFCDNCTDISYINVTIYAHIANRMNLSWTTKIVQERKLDAYQLRTFHFIIVVVD